MRRAPWLTVCLALAGCVAHLPRPDEPMAFMERSTVAYSPGSGQLFEADPAIHVYFHNGLDDPELQGVGGWAYTTTFSFLAAVRMMDEPSTPVRTPSYEPRLKLQVLRLGTPRPGERSVQRLLGGLELVVAHYSNGQKGCALADHLRGSGFSDFDCIPLPGADPPSTALNTADGSFTTNYAALNANGRWMRFGPAGGKARATAALGAGIEWHLPCAFAGCMDPPMRARHGEAVARFAAEADVLLLDGYRRALPLLGVFVLDARLRVTARGSLHFPSASGAFGDLSLEAAFVPRYGSGLGIGPFLRVHRGRDPLNIRFEETLDTWSFGIVVDPAPPERLDAGPVH
jgi:hypothetical protein